MRNPLDERALEAAIQAAGLGQSHLLRVSIIKAIRAYLEDTQVGESEAVAYVTRTFALSVMLSKSISGGMKQSSMIGYRRCATEDEARGSFMRAIDKKKPGFSIEQLLCIEIPVLAGQEKQE